MTIKNIKYELMSKTDLETTNLFFKSLQNTSLSIKDARVMTNIIIELYNKYAVKYESEDDAYQAGYDDGYHDGHYDAISHEYKH